MKLLLYCNKTKPYLNCDFGKETHEDYFGNWFIYLANKEDECSNIVNDKIVAECDFDVEEIKVGNSYTVGFGSVEYIKTDTLQLNELLQRSCLSVGQLKSYIQKDGNGEFYGYGGYAIHIKNLHIFNEPKKLGNYYSQNQVDFIEETELWRLKNGVMDAPRNMQKVYQYNFKDCKLDDYILISIRPEQLCKILNGKQTTIVRRKVLKGMVK